MRYSFTTTYALALFAFISPVSQAAAEVTIDWVTVGNAGNTADTTGFGAVGYEFHIGKNEVTWAQYGAFLNAAAQTDNYSLYSEEMSYWGMQRSGDQGTYTYSVTSGWDNRPVTYVSWFDAARFANWLHNGQGSGSTETGAYTLNGAVDGIVIKNPGAKVWIPSEDEWYKAAYYNGSSSTYSLFPNGQNTITGSEANYLDSEIGATSDVGTYTGDPSFYGTFDQGGNVTEWNDAVSDDSLRGLRGGSYETSDGFIQSITSGYTSPTDEMYDAGFRVASAVVPEPSGMVLVILLCSGLVCSRKR